MVIMIHLDNETHWDTSVARECQKNDSNLTQARGLPPLKHILKSKRKEYMSLLCGMADSLTKCHHFPSCIGSPLRLPLACVLRNFHVFMLRESYMTVYVFLQNFLSMCSYFPLFSQMFSHVLHVSCIVTSPSSIHSLTLYHSYGHGTVQVSTAKWNSYDGYQPILSLLPFFLAPKYNELLLLWVLLVGGCHRLTVALTWWSWGQIQVFHLPIRSTLYAHDISEWPPQVNHSQRCSNAHSYTLVLSTKPVCQC